MLTIGRGGGRWLTSISLAMPSGRWLVTVSVAFDSRPKASLGVSAVSALIFACSAHWHAPRTDRSRSLSDIDGPLHAGILVAGDRADVLVGALGRWRELQRDGLAWLRDDRQSTRRLIGLDRREGRIMLDDALVLEGDPDRLPDLRLKRRRGELQVRGDDLRVDSRLCSGCRLRRRRSLRYGRCLDSDPHRPHSRRARQTERGKL